MARVITEKGKRGFLLWMKANQPVLYKAVQAKGKTGALDGFGDVNPLDPSNPSVTNAPATSSWVDSVKNLFTGAAQIYLTKTQLDGQRKVLDMQLQRAQAGLPPLNIDPNMYGLNPTVGVGLSPDTKRLLMYGAGGIAVLWLFGMFRSYRK